ncbi:phosphoenolpyruvate carboxykinase (ATP) [Pedobacter sp. JY14-1]|uniref:phosphoenolpyruvate carboxykinase (ATP) n=1 Tax=Pedobacter sp. JY14-1 TaxID=3034151 RepID=UPI0023E31DC9|nr:phosphoenolpyruvate carboxykinase (ATP) [Pedobacter sp. JY14-1]
MDKVSMFQPDLSGHGLDQQKALYQLNVSELVAAITDPDKPEGWITDKNAVAVDTGTFTGRSPKDRFIVRDDITARRVDWGEINIPFEAAHFDRLLGRMIATLNEKPFYVRDCYACAHEAYRLPVRVITETAYQNLFAHNLFLRYTDYEGLRLREEGNDMKEAWTIIAVPSFQADPKTDGTRQGNFTIISFSKKMILIGGTGYTGEIKKGIFSVLNFLLPENHHVLPMHCSANAGQEGDTAIFFGLSGTGKTTLSADAGRRLIGDDEHGWTAEGIFNFEGGCYAKCVGLSEEKEPEIYHAIRPGALLENVCPFSGTSKVDFDNISKTENTRVAYPLDFVDNALLPSVSSTPGNIFFLTADACGVLPPISRLTTEQAMFHFLSGYTAKVAGTETGITEPQLTFSACFGKAFLPLHPSRYAIMLGEKLKEQHVNVWLVNTGWTGGAYGTGQRIKLSYTRAMVRAALDGSLAKEAYVADPFFGLQMPVSCPGVPDNVLNPRNTWTDTAGYDLKASELAEAFLVNYKQINDPSMPDLSSALPLIKYTSML